MSLLRKEAPLLNPLPFGERAGCEKEEK